MFRLFLSLKCRKNANTNNIEGGRGAKTNLCVGFLWVLWVFFCFFRSPFFSSAISKFVMKFHLKISQHTSAGMATLTNNQQFREKQRGGENSGEERTYHKGPPQKRFWTPPPMIRFPPPPPPCSRNVILLIGNGQRPPKLVLEGALYGTFPPPPPPKSARYVLPPLCEFPSDDRLP